jgi:anti-sigma B factor antagonist
MTPDGDGRGASGRGEDEFALRIDELDGSVFVAARGDVDVESVTAFNDGLREAVSRTPPEVRVDLAGITFLGSEGIRSLVLAHGAAAAQGTRLMVTAASPIVRRVLTLTESDGLLGG